MHDNTENDLRSQWTQAGIEGKQTLHFGRGRNAIVNNDLGQLQAIWRLVDTVADPHAGIFGHRYCHELAEATGLRRLGDRLDVEAIGKRAQIVKAILERATTKNYGHKFFAEYDDDADGSSFHHAFVSAATDDVTVEVLQALWDWLGQDQGKKNAALQYNDYWAFMLAASHNPAGFRKLWSLADDAIKLQAVAARHNDNIWDLLRADRVSYDFVCANSSPELSRIISAKVPYPPSANPIDAHSILASIAGSLER